jgi:meiosis-specific protein HOP1
MANVQLVRTRQTYATTTINEVQSIQLVQTMLHGALSSLTYLRDLFPEKAFEDRYYEMRETPLPYADFAAARMPSLKAEADQHSTKVPILLRQRSKRADLFLDWLVSAFSRHRQWHADNLQEKGVFPELDSGELRAVQLLIHPDKTSRDTVLETYTFTVHYTVSEDGRRTPSGLAASSSENTVATTKATNTALQQLLRNVSSLCEDLPMLPGKLIASA